MTPGGDHVAGLDAKQVEDIEDGARLVTAIEIKINPQKWVKKHESQVCECDKPKLKVVVLHDGIGKEVHMTQPVRFLVGDLVKIA